MRSGAGRALLATALAAAVTGACASVPATPPERFDYDWSVRTLDHAEVPVERYRGRVLVVNVWATWCPPCVAELASFEVLAGRVDPERVALLLVSPESASVVEAFQRRHELAAPLVVESRPLPESLGALVLPTTFVVDPTGRVALRHRGAADWGDPRVAAFLDSLSPRPEFRLRSVEAGGFTLDMAIPEGWYLYAPDPGQAGLPLRLEWVWPSAASERPDAVEGARYPEPDTVRSFGARVHVYRGRQVVLLDQPPLVGGVRPTALRIVWALCREDRCVPGTSEVALDGRGASGRFRGNVTRAAFHSDRPHPTFRP